MKRMLTMLLAVVMLISLFPSAAFAAEAPGLVEKTAAITGIDDGNLQSTTELTPETNPVSMTRSGGDKMDTSYLYISLEKYGKTVSASSTSGKTVNVLPYTQWQMTARFVRVYDGKVEADQDVTNQCRWSSSDSTGNVLSVSETGLVTASMASDVSFGITASYDGFIGVPAENGTELQPETFNAQMDFCVLLPDIEEDDKETLRCLAFSYLADHEWGQLLLHEGETIDSWLASVQSDYLDGVIYTSLHQYILSGTEGNEKYRNAARLAHFISAVAGDYTIQRANLADVANANHVRGVLFSNGSKNYLAYRYDEPKYNKKTAAEFSSAETHVFHTLETYDKVIYSFWEKDFLAGKNIYDMAAVNARNIKIVGLYFGGTIAKYASYVRGADAVTFEAPSPIQYVFWNNLAEFCKYYSVHRQENYNLAPTDTQTAAMFSMEPTSYVTANVTHAIPFLSYIKNRDFICLAKHSALTFNKEQTLWNRRAYLGNDDSDIYQDTGALTIKLNNSILFGGGNFDAFTVKYAQMESAPLIQALNELVFGKSSLMVKGVKILLSLGFKVPTGREDIALLLANSPVNSNIICGGKGDDELNGSAWNNSFYYTPGDGQDVYYLKGFWNKFYFVGYANENIEVTCDNTKNKNQYVITVDSSDTFTIDISECILTETFRPFILYQGTPGNEKEIDVSSVQLVNHLDAWSFACPVDVQILDADGQVVQQLQDGKESSVLTEYGAFSVTLEEGEYVKTVVRFDNSYRIQLRGSGNGEMKAERVRWSMDGADAQYCSINHIPVQEDAVYYPSDDLEECILKADLDGDGNVDNTVSFDTNVSLEQNVCEIPYGTRKQLSVDVATSSTDHDCIWYSSDIGVAAVDDEGTVTAMGFGEAEIYAMAADGSGAYDSCRITVPEETLSAENFTVTGLEPEHAYTGDVIDVQLAVSYGCFTLTQDVHYTVQFSELVEPGKATVTVTGIDDYTGTISRGYEILASQEPDTVEKKVDWIAEECRKTGLTEPWEIALWLHDWLIYNANYDYTYTYYHPDGVLLQGTGVCQSYSEAYALLLDEFGIENQVLSAPEMDHAWNLVKIDGEWCHIDCTWDDPGTGGSENYTYFGMNDTLMKRDHVWNTNAYPASTSKKNLYLIRRNENVVESQEELEVFLSEMAQAQTEAFVCYYIGENSDFSLMEAFQEWFAANNWKYGLSGYDIGGTQWMLRAEVSYAEPWDPPADITDGVDCPRFILRGPDGVYPIGNYAGNGAVLIFGRHTCGNTMALLDSLHPYAQSLKNEGIQVFVNLEDTYVPSDYASLKQEYPSFVYTYYDNFLYNSLAQQIGLSGIVYYPVVLIIDGGDQIIGSSTGYVYNLEELLSEIERTATGQPLPAPEPVDENFYGAFFNYTGNADALSRYIGDQLASGIETIFARDGTWTGNPQDWTSGTLGSAMLTALDPYRSDPAYEIPYGWTYYPGLQIVSVHVGYRDHLEHTPETIPGMEATCTEDGLSEGKQCSVCGAVIEEQQTIPAKGHSYTDDYDATCDVCGEERDVTEPGEPSEPTEPEVESVPMHRMYDPNSGEHFYTGSEVERDFLVTAGWHYEGVGFNFPFEGRPVYRLYDPVYGEHLYTMDEAEKAKLISWGWNDEGVAFNSAEDDEVPQYRLHNPNAERGGYHFTGSIEERDFLISIGWINEGIGWYSCLE